MAHRSDSGATYHFRAFASNSAGISYGSNVSFATPVAGPTFIGAATNTSGTKITLTFSKTMADPAGKHAQFNVTVNGVGDAVTVASLAQDPVKIDLTLAAPIVRGQTITVGYTVGTVVAADGGMLESFAGQAVTNNVPDAHVSDSGGGGDDSSASTTVIPAAGPAPATLDTRVKAGHNAERTASNLTDVAGHWAESNIKLLVTLGAVPAIFVLLNNTTWNTPGASLY